MSGQPLVGGGDDEDDDDDDDEPVEGVNCCVQDHCVLPMVLVCV